MSKILYISDTHFCHANMLKYDERPWLTIEEGDKALIEKWNTAVTDDDLVYMLGDFVWGNYENCKNIISQLKGQIYIIKGNHDRSANLNKLMVDFPRKILGWSEQTTICDNDRMVVLNHCPILCYSNMFRGWYHLFGHVHKTLDFDIFRYAKEKMEMNYNMKFPMYNVGALLLDYTPRTLDEIVEIFKQPDISVSPKQILNRI